VASIQKRPNGKWRASYRDEEGREHSRHFDRKVDAQKHLDKVTAVLLTGTHVDSKSGKVTLESFFADWSSRQVWAPATLSIARNAVKGCTFRDVPLDRVRRSHVESWVKSVTMTMQPSTIATRNRFIRGVLRGAVRDQVLAVDPSVGVVLPRQRRAEHRMTTPTSERVGWLLDSIKELYRPFIAVCAFAGLRIGEAAGLQVGDIDFLRRTLHVQRQAQNNGGVVEVSPPKSGSERVVSIPDELVTLIAQHLERLGTLRSTSSGWARSATMGGCSRARPQRRRVCGTGSVEQPMRPASRESAPVICGTTLPRASLPPAATL
jgi:hypothetical protein